MTLKAEKVAGIIQKEVSEIIQFQLKDPENWFHYHYGCDSDK